MDGGKLTPWERAKSHTSLLCLLQGLQGKITTVELRNECSVTGRIDHVNGHMGTYMNNVVFKDMFEVETKMEEFYVKGSHIRFVLIPDEVNIIQTMEKQLKFLRNEGGRGSPPQGTSASGRGRGFLRDKAQANKSVSQNKNLLQKDKSKGKDRFEAYMTAKEATKPKSNSEDMPPQGGESSDSKTLKDPKD